MKPWLRTAFLVGGGILVGVGLTLGIQALAARLKTASAPFDPTTGPITVSIAGTACFGTCPIYTIAASADGGEKTGTVVFDGRGFTCTRGRVSRSISRASLEALAGRLEQRGFFGLNGEYTEMGWTDAPTIIVSVSAGGRAQTVTHYQGAANAPNTLPDAAPTAAAP